MKRKKDVPMFNSLAEAISVSREKLGITQREVSRRTGIDNNTIAKIEKGERKKPNTLSLKKLAYILDIDQDYLLQLAGYNDEEIKIANNAVGANMYMQGNNDEVILVEELIMQSEYKKMAYPALVELIDTADINNLKYLKGKSKQDITKIKEGLKVLRNEFINIEKEKVKLTYEE